jgi:outer membrane protein OmpA-like peptidoglycan-associated protein
MPNLFERKAPAGSPPPRRAQTTGALMSLVLITASNCLLAEASAQGLEPTNALSERSTAAPATSPSTVTGLSGEILSNPSLQDLQRAFIADGSRKPRMRSIVVESEPAPPSRTVAIAIPFQMNSATLSSESNALIEHLSLVLREVTRTARVAIEGHTDASGPSELNRRLSLARAESVMRALVAQSIAPTRLHVEGHGSDRLLTGLMPTDPSHRRVQFRVESQP